jgi:hypothetical protein
VAEVCVAVVIGVYLLRKGARHKKKNHESDWRCSLCTSHLFTFPFSSSAHAPCSRVSAKSRAVMEPSSKKGLWEVLQKTLKNHEKLGMVPLERPDIPAPFRSSLDCFRGIQPKQLGQEA